MTGKNSEGYSDPTASIAISRATRKENKMDTARPGEIWIVQSAGLSPCAHPRRQWKDSNIHQAEKGMAERGMHG